MTTITHEFIPHMLIVQRTMALGILRYELDLPRDSWIETVQKVPGGVSVVVRRTDDPQIEKQVIVFVKCSKEIPFAYRFLGANTDLDYSIIQPLYTGDSALQHIEQA